MASWTVIVIGVALSVVIVAPGISLFWPHRDHPESWQRELGAALMTGAVVSLAVFVLGALVDMRSRDEEHKRQDRAQLDDLLQGDVLHGAALQGKHLQRAVPDEQGLRLAPT